MEATQRQLPENSTGSAGALTLTREQAAKRLQISISMLDTLTKAGRIGHFKAGRRILFNDDHLVQYLSSIQRGTRAA